MILLLFHIFYVPLSCMYSVRPPPLCVLYAKNLKGERARRAIFVSFPTKMTTLYLRYIIVCIILLCTYCTDQFGVEAHRRG